MKSNVKRKNFLNAFEIVGNSNNPNLGQVIDPLLNETWISFVINIPVMKPMNRDGDNNKKEILEVRQWTGANMGYSEIINRSRTGVYRTVLWWWSCFGVLRRRMYGNGRCWYEELGTEWDIHLQVNEIHGEGYLINHAAAVM